MIPEKKESIIFKVYCNVIISNVSIYNNKMPPIFMKYVELKY